MRWPIPRYSLRVLLLTVTILAVAGGIYCHTVQRQQREVRAVIALGGSVNYDSPFDDPFSEEPSQFLVLIRELLGDDCIFNVDSVDLYRTRNINRALADIADFTICNDITFLGLSGLDITDGAMADVATFANLDWLDISDTQITDAGLLYLKPLSKLQHLDLRNTNISRSGYKDLEQALPQCTLYGDVHVLPTQNSGKVAPPSPPW